MKIRISKKVKASKRGLTFSFEQGDTFRAGVHYRYIVDKHSNEIIIVPDTTEYCLHIRPPVPIFRPTSA